MFYSLCQRESVQVAVCVDGVDFSQVDKLLQGLVDENEADEGCKGLLCEACDVTHQGAGICGHQHQTHEGRPQANTGPQRQVRQVIVPDRDMRREQ